MTEPTNPIEAKQRKINTWLRYHTDYQVTIHLHSLYGCIQATVERNGKWEASWIGNTLEKRLDQVIEYLKIDEVGHDQ